jgi:protein gp37
VIIATPSCGPNAWGHQLWGLDAPRRFFSDAHWREPLIWNEEARLNGRRDRVFCASMADVFERRKDLNDERVRLWELIDNTPNLDWLLLTKRPQNVERIVPWDKSWPVNVWLGTSVENQTLAEKRLPFLLKIPAVVRFLSCEPLLGNLNLRSWFKRKGFHPIDWIIAGGESGGGSRPMHPDWVVSLLRQCQSYNVPFHFKQWGQWAPAQLVTKPVKPRRVEIGHERPVELVRMGKKRTGRMLEGAVWDGLPHLLSHA